MRRMMIIGLLGGLAFSGFASAGEPRTVPRDSVKTWIITVDGKDYEAHPATPTYEGTTGLFHLPSAYTLPRKKMSFSLFRDNLDRDPKDEDISIHGVTFGYGATDRLELFGSFGLQNRIDADALSQPGFVNDYPFVSTPWQTGAGDIKLGLKYKLLDDYQGDGVGLAVRGFVKLGTADQNKGLGTGKSSGGMDLLLSKSLGRVVDIHGGLGYQVNSDPKDPRPVKIGNAVKWGVGLNFPTRRVVQIQAELTGASYKGAAFKQTNPADFIIGPVFYIKGFFIRPAVSKNLNFDGRGLNSGGKSSTGMQLSVGYHPGTICCAIAVPPPPPPPPPPPTPAPAPANRPPTVSCEAARSTISPGETVTLRAMATDPDGNTLTYAWTSVGGRIAGSGASVTLETPGVTPPADLTATVRVSDDRGGTAEATCRVRMPAPPPPPALITCESGGFPMNRVRLNNVDKACLDDVAARLRQDPRGRATITGYADAAESRPSVLARQRAEAARAYLVKERGVDDARITVRSVSMPRDASGKSRRVELVFVPDGAVPPVEK